MSATSVSASRTHIFSSRSFRQYFIGQSFSLIGDGFRTLAIPLLVFHLTGSALSTGLSYACEFAPFGICSLIGGSLADRYDRRTLMIGADALRFAVMAGFAALFAVHLLTISMLYGGLILISIAAAVFLGGQTSSIPFLLGKDRGTEAVAALSGAENVSNLITPIAGGAMFSMFGPLPALIVNAATYAISQFSLSRIPSLGPAQPSGLPNVRHIVDDVVAGFRILFSDPAMRACAIAGFFINFLGFGMYAVLIPYLKLDFHATDPQIGVFMGITALGAVAGSAFSSRYATRWPFGPALAIAYVVDAVIFATVPLARNIWLMAALWALANAGWQFEIAQIIGFRLRVTPEEYVGRLFGAVRVFVLCGIAPAVVSIGYLADRYGPQAAMTLIAVAYLLVAILAGLSPSVRNERR